MVGGDLVKARDGKPAPAERAALVAGLVGLGYKGPELAGIVKAGMTRGGIADALIALQREARKG